jgi:hypothetical protein
MPGLGPKSVLLEARRKRGQIAAQRFGEPGIWSADRHLHFSAMFGQPHVDPLLAPTELQANFTRRRGQEHRRLGRRGDGGTVRLGNRRVRGGRGGGRRRNVRDTSRIGNRQGLGVADR